MEYKITKEQCQATINKAKPIVCTHCGGQLSPVRTVDNANNPTYWVGCNGCNHFDNGTTPEHYEIAKRMVIERRLRPYNHLKEPIKENNLVDYKYWLISQIGGAVSIVEDIITLYKFK